MNSGPAVKRVLVVEDDPTVRRMCVLSLDQAGYQIDEACDGLAGLEAALKNRYDLIVTDNNMPRLSGLQMIARMRAARKEVPVVMASGTITEEDLVRHNTLKITAAVPKPYDVGQLVETVRRILGAPSGVERRPAGAANLITAGSMLSPRWGINE